MAECLKVVEAQLEKKKIKRDVDVTELYLASSKLVNLIDMSRFKNLQFMWLNSNKIRELGCLKCNFRLAELYLQDNCLVDITGALGHLTNLQVLFLNNNQLVKLDKVVKELIFVQGLHTLNLFDNPVAQEAEYRPYVIHHLPSVTLLDRQEVLKGERDEGRALYDQENKAVADRIAFGRRSQGPPNLYYPADGRGREPTQPASYEVGNNFYRDKTRSGEVKMRKTSRCAPDVGHDPLSCTCAQPKLSPPYPSEQDAVRARQLRRSVMEVTSFDWSKVPRAEQRRLRESAFDTPQVVTTRFR